MTAPYPYRSAWPQRAQVIASAIPPGASVVDLGGGVQTLRQFLRCPRGYVSIDRYPCTPDTVVSDFNKGEYPVYSADYVVAQGIVEYLTNPEEFFTKARQYAPVLLFTYLEPGPRMAEPRGHSLTRKEVEDIATEAGWTIVFSRTATHGQRLYYCTQQTKP